MKLTSQQQLIVAGVLIVLVAVAFVFLFIVPKFSELAQAHDESLKADTAIAEAKTLLAKRQEAKVAAAETQAKLTRLENQVPDAPEMPATLIELQDTANDAGVHFDKLVITKPTAVTEGYQKIHVAFEVVGSWDDVVDYLRRLSELERAIRVLDVSMSPHVAPNPTGQTVAQATDDEIKTTLNVEVYMVPRTSGPGGAPAAPQPGQ